jgi:hypothetical protein
MERDTFERANGYTERNRRRNHQTGETYNTRLSNEEESEKKNQASNQPQTSPPKFQQKKKAHNRGGDLHMIIQAALG